MVSGIGCYSKEPDNVGLGMKVKDIELEKQLDVINRA